MSEILQPVQLKDMDEVIGLAAKAYPEKIRGGVLASLSLHKFGMESGISLGGQLFKAVENESITGVCGFYRRGDKCPPDIIWGDWFFVDPRVRGSKLAYKMGSELITKAIRSGYKSIWVETTDSNPDYFNIEPYLSKLGFKREAQISDYFGKGIALIFMSLKL